MSDLKIVLWPEPVLLKPTKPIDRVEEPIAVLADEMASAMYAAPGVGLAANQVGKDLRMAVIDVSSMDKEKDLHVLINPEIIHAEGKEIMEEGCLSLPGFKSDVQRAGKVVVRAMDLDMKPFEIEAEGLLARALQHEIDHLNGKLFPDRISRLKREMLFRKIKKAIETGEFGHDHEE